MEPAPIPFRAPKPPRRPEPAPAPPPAPAHAFEAEVVDLPEPEPWRPEWPKELLDEPARPAAGASTADSGQDRRPEPPCPTAEPPRPGRKENGGFKLPDWLDI